jgi:phage portal protein BeeE
MGFKDAFLAPARRGRAIQLRSLTGASYGGAYGWNGQGYGSQQDGVDYNQEAGLRYDNSIVYSCLDFLCACLNSVPLKVARLENGRPKIIPNHPLELFLARPNPWYDGSLITSVSGFLEGARGNSYCYKHRNANTNEMVALEVIPDSQCWPYTIPGSGDFISEYRITSPVGYLRVPPIDVMQIRWRTPYPRWPVLGMSPIEACLADLVADKLSARHEAALLRNSGMSSISVAPVQAKDGMPQPIFTASQQQSLKASIMDKVSGDNKGAPMIWQEPVDIQQLGFDPKAMLCTEVRYMSEARICSCFKFQPVVLGLGTGLEKSNNRASIQGAVDITILQGVLPAMRYRAAQISEDLIPELGEPGEIVVYDESQLPYLQDLIMRQVMEAAGGPVISVNEGRAMVGRPKTKGGDVVRDSQPKTAPEPESKMNPSSSKNGHIEVFN